MTTDSFRGRTVVPRVISILVFCIGCMVLMGWHFDIAVLRSSLLWFDPMTPVTAGAFLLLAGALWLLGGKEEVLRGLRWYVAQSLTGIVALTGLLTLLNTHTIPHGTTNQLLLANELVRIPMGGVTRMAHSTAFCLVLSACALLLSNSSGKKTRMIQLLVLIVSFLSLLALVGYFFSIRSFPGIGLYIDMAFSAAFLFLLLSAGILWLFPDRGILRTFLNQHTGGLLARNLLSFAIGVPLLIGWLSLEMQNIFKFKYELGVGMMVVSIIVLFTFMIYRNAALVNRLDAERKEAREKIAVLLQEAQSINQQLKAQQEELQHSLASALELNNRLSLSESKLVESQRIAHLGSWEYELASGTITWSEEKYRIFGLDPAGEAPQFEKYLSMIHPEDREKLTQAIERAITQRKDYELEIRIIQPNGAIRWTFSVGKPTTSGQDDAVVRLFGITLDITGRKLAETALRDSEKRYRTLVELLPDGVLTIQQGLIKYANPAALKLLGANQPEALLEHPAFDFVHPDSHQLVQQSIEKVTQGETIPAATQQLVRPDGSTFEAEVTATRLTTDLPQTHLVLIHDVTSRKKAEKALSDSQQFYTALFENSSDFVQTLSADGIVLFQSDTFQRLSGYTFEERKGRSIFELMHPEDQKKGKAFLEKLVKCPGETWVVESRIRHKDGSWRWVESTATNLLNEPVIQAIVVNNRDITERKLAAEQLKRQNQELLKTNAELDRFVYRASHDLRAPLASVLGLINITKGETDESTKAHYFELMTRSILKLDAFIHSIIDYSRNARLEIKGAPVDFDLIVSDTLEDLKYMEKNEQITKQVRIQAKAPFLSDEFRLKIIFSNIISNAIRYSNSRVQSYLRIGIETDEERALLVFEDNGCGIAAENLDKIFDMFYRASSNNEGSGLGLYIVKEVVQALQGTITVQSVLGEGTTFTIELPNSEGKAG